MDAQVFKHKSLLPKVKIANAQAEYNHECHISGSVLTFKLSGMAAKEAISQVTLVLVSRITSKKPLPCNLIRWTIKPHISKGIVLDSTAILNIMCGVHAQIVKGTYTAPPSIIDIDVTKAFTTVYITSENCSQYPSNLIYNSNGDNS